jgi:predicted TIM-barrel fold metal-dependent hydrolase
MPLFLSSKMLIPKNWRPLMVVDVHTHIFFPEICRNREHFCKRDRSFSAIYHDPRARMVEREQLTENMAKDGVKKSVVFGFPWADSGLCREHNEYILDSMNLYPDSLIGFCSFSPASGKQCIPDIEKFLDSGMKGVGEIASYSGSSKKEIDFFDPLMTILKERGLPLLLHVTEGVGHDYPGKSHTDMRWLYGFIKRYPDVDIILAHWGGGLFFYELMPEVSRACKRVYYDTAASPFLYSPGIYGIAIDIVGNDRILFGSDYPLIPPSRYIKEMKEAAISIKNMSKITGQNAARVLNL